ALRVESAGEIIEVFRAFGFRREPMHGDALVGTRSGFVLVPPGAVVDRTAREDFDLDAALRESDGELTRDRLGTTADLLPVAMNDERNLHRCAVMVCNSFSPTRSGANALTRSCPASTTAARASASVVNRLTATAKSTKSFRPRMTPPLPTVSGTAAAP